MIHIMVTSSFNDLIFLAFPENLFATKSDFIWHLNDHCSWDLKIKNMTFKDMAEFEKWKNKGEKRTKSWYEKQRADRKTNHYRNSWF